MEKEKGGRCITVWLGRADLENLQRLAGERGDTVSGLLRAAAQRVETAGASVDLTPILQAQGQALAALEERLTAEFRAAAGLLATLEHLNVVRQKMQG